MSEAGQEGNILDRIVYARKEDLREKGSSLGYPIPETRRVPLVPFRRKRLLICEIKGRSPSKGAILPDLDAVAQAGLYIERGAHAVSVLTEERFFGGSLADLMAVKRRYPNLPVLRKDFLLEPADIDVSYRSGADAVLLIAGILDESRLSELHDRARSFGMEVLVEVHTGDDIRKAERTRPGLTGINCRNLETFRIDPLLPLLIRSRIPWETEFVYESGIGSGEDARLAGASGFGGILVGEAVVKEPSLAENLLHGLEEGQAAGGKPFFWTSLCERKKPMTPLVKICGITNERDMRKAESFGADVLGFVLAPSPRSVTLDFLASTGRTSAMKVAVVVGGRVESGPTGGRYSDPAVLEALQDLIAAGTIDAVQFHGNEDFLSCSRTAFPYYKAVGVNSPADIEASRAYRCPRVLFDAKLHESTGGTGIRIPEELAGKAAAEGTLWLAGGLGPNNIEEVTARLNPELVDASSRLERAPGLKDHGALEAFFGALQRGAESAKGALR